MRDDATTRNTTAHRRDRVRRNRREQVPVVELTPAQVERVLCALTPAQVARVVLQASGEQQLSKSLTRIDSLDVLGLAIRPLLDDSTYSHSMLRAAMVLATFPADGSERELTSTARAIGLSPSTAHRYIRTWAALGVLEQDPDSQRYRRTHPRDAYS